MKRIEVEKEAVLVGRLRKLKLGRVGTISRLSSFGELVIVGMKVGAHKVPRGPFGLPLQ